jgi:hypothetical protein
MGDAGCCIMAWIIIEPLLETAPESAVDKPTHKTQVHHMNLSDRPSVIDLLHRHRCAALAREFRQPATAWNARLHTRLRHEAPPPLWQNRRQE